MEGKIDKALYEIAELRKRIDNLQRDLSEVKKVQEDTKRIIDEGKQNDDMLRQLTRDIKEMKTEGHYNAINIKEMMDGMGTIYRSVDELEENVVPERKTT